MDRFKTLLPEDKNKSAKNVDLYIPFKLKNSNNLNGYDNIISTLDVEEQFNRERQNSESYRISGKINLLYSTDFLGTDNSTPEEGLSFTPQDKNWLLKITIPNGIIENYGLQENNIPIERGFRYFLTGYTYNNKNTIAIVTELKNNINIGDYVYCEHINFQTNNINTGLAGREEINGIHKVIYKGNPITGQNSDTILVLDLDNTFNLIPFANRHGIVKKITNPSLDDFSKENYLTTINRFYILNNKQYIEFNQPHNLLDGDFISIKGYLLNFTNSTFAGIHRVKYVDDLNVELYYKTQVVTPNIPVSTFSEMKWKRLDGCPSQYFMRSFEIITSNYDNITLPERDYEIYNSGFEVDIFNRKKYLFNFKEIDLGIYKDYLGRDLTDVYLTVLKRPGEFPYNFTLSDVHFHNYSLKGSGSGLKLKWSGNSTNEFVTNYNNIDGNLNLDKIKIKGDKYFGDIMEYIVSNLEENIVLEPIFRFNSVNREDIFLQTGSIIRLNGWIYKPHHRIPIRKLSATIEQFDFSDVAEFPDYAEPYKEKFIWRDLLDKGFIEDTINGVSYPFLNNNHYIFNIFNLTLKPQNPEIIDGYIIKEEDINQFPNEC
jgi:hypothetical protein